MLELDDTASRKIYSPLTEEEFATYNILVDSPNFIQPSSVFVSSVLNVSAGNAPTDNLQGCTASDIVGVQDGPWGSTSSTALLTVLDQNDARTILPTASPSPLQQEAPPALGTLEPTRATGDSIPATHHTAPMPGDTSLATTAPAGVALGDVTAPADTAPTSTVASLEVTTASVTAPTKLLVGKSTTPTVKASPSPPALGIKSVLVAPPAEEQAGPTLPVDGPMTPTATPAEVRGGATFAGVRGSVLPTAPSPTTPPTIVLEGTTHRAPSPATPGAAVASAMAVGETGVPVLLGATEDPTTATTTTTAASLPGSPTAPSQPAKASPIVGVYKPSAAAPPIKELRRSSRNAAMAEVHTLLKGPNMARGG